MYYSHNNWGWGIGTFFYFLLILAAAGFYFYCYWRIFEKAGRKGWEGLIPGHNVLELFLMVGRPGWWFFLMLIPVANIVIAIMLIFDLAKVFGKETGFGFGILFLSFVFIPILALGDAEYQGPLTFE
ncbi:MAG TPA: signal peptidase I [Anaerolineaceae bacterium]|nr:signal peptidase I [Anaerolineaceae bacterium]